MSFLSLRHGGPVALHRGSYCSQPYMSLQGVCVHKSVCIFLSTNNSMLFYALLFFLLALSWYSFPVSTHTASPSFLIA